MINKYLCINGPRQGEYIPQREDNEYFLYSRSSQTARDGSKKGWYINDFPTAILVYIKSLE